MDKTADDMCDDASPANFLYHMALFAAARSPHLPGHGGIHKTTREAISSSYAHR